MVCGKLIISSSSSSSSSSTIVRSLSCRGVRCSGKPVVTMGEYLTGEKLGVAGYAGSQIARGRSRDLSQTWSWMIILSRILQAERRTGLVSSKTLYSLCSFDISQHKSTLEIHQHHIHRRTKITLWPWPLQFCFRMFVVNVFHTPVQCEIRIAESYGHFLFQHYAACDLDLWPFKLKSASSVTRETDHFYIALFTFSTDSTINRK